MSYKLHYFNAPGRAEVARLCMSIGEIPYEDILYTNATFPESKPKMPFGQLPVLELPDGKMLAQSGAIDRYTAKLAGLYPEDPLAAARADEAVFLLNEFTDLFIPTYFMPLEEKIKAREELMAGKGGDKLQQLNKYIANLGEGSFIAGNKLSFADLAIFTFMSSLISGLYEGIPTTLLDSYVAIKALRNKVASEPGVKAFYEKNSEGIRAAFKPDAA